MGDGRFVKNHEVTENLIEPNETSRMRRGFYCGGTINPDIG
jgi:hypothetical protein